MKKPDIYLKEYCGRLNDDGLKFLAGRLTQRLAGDVEEVLVYLSEVKEIDRWLASAGSCWELFDMVDLVSVASIREYDRRFAA